MSRRNAGIGYSLYESRYGHSSGPLKTIKGLVLFPLRLGGEGQGERRHGDRHSRGPAISGLTWKQHVAALAGKNYLPP